ncbi:hypothetical protein amrb99_35220 [Actinomadura sp. RB99]|nr:hypothetical protein [Actinomadura sp. RB99]
MRRSIESSSLSWRCSSVWLRRARLTKTSLTLRRSVASSTAPWMAVRRAALNASPTWSISRVPNASGGASAATSTSSPRRSRRITPGSRTSARSMASRRSRASSRITDRATHTAMTRDATTARRPRTPASTTRVMMPSEIGLARCSAPAATDSSRPRSRVRLESAVVFHSVPESVDGRTSVRDATNRSSSARSRAYSGMPVTRW